jgi:hypothetical protein
LRSATSHNSHLIFLNNNSSCWLCNCDIERIVFMDLSRDQTREAMDDVGLWTACDEEHFAITFGL